MTAGEVPGEDVQEALEWLTSLPWRHGEPCVLAPAMTAIVAAAAALDLTGEVLPADVAPADSGVLFLPERVRAGDATGSPPEDRCDQRRPLRPRAPYLCRGGGQTVGPSPLLRMASSAPASSGGP